MSSILLSNPFVPQPLPAVEGGKHLDNPGAIAPMPGGASSKGAEQRDTAGKFAGRQPRDRPDRQHLVEASPKSVIDAQTSVNGAKQPIDTPDWNPSIDRAEVMASLPDPLPTSPYLKRKEQAG